MLLLFIISFSSSFDCCWYWWFLCRKITRYFNKTITELYLCFNLVSPHCCISINQLLKFFFLRLLFWFWFQVQCKHEIAQVKMMKTMKRRRKNCVAGTKWNAYRIISFRLYAFIMRLFCLQYLIRIHCVFRKKKISIRSLLWQLVTMHWLSHCSIHKICKHLVLWKEFEWERKFYINISHSIGFQHESFMEFGVRANSLFNSISICRWFWNFCVNYVWKFNIKTIEEILSYMKQLMLLLKKKTILFSISFECRMPINDWNSRWMLHVEWMKMNFLWK